VEVITDRQNKDKAKGYLSCSFMVLAFILPVAGFFLGVGRLGFETAVAVAGGLFILLMLTAVVIALTIEHLSWLFTFLPLLSSFIYTIAPDFVPGPVEDAIVVAIGAFFTIVLIIRKIAPSYILLALLVTGVYAWFGRDFMAGFADEVVLFLVMLLLGFVAHRNYQQRLSSE